MIGFNRKSYSTKLVLYFHNDPLTMSGSKSIQEKASKKPNVKIRKPVPSNKLIEVGSEYDIGLVVCRPSNFNLRNGMPNRIN